jgi:hypothetical protein
MYSTSLIALSRFGACLATTAPDTLMWVPPPWKVGRITCTASTHFFCSGEPLPISPM